MKVLRSAGRIDAVAGDGIGANDVEGGELTVGGGIEHLDQVEAGLRGERRAVLLREARSVGHRHVAGQQIGIEAHVRCAAGIGVIAQAGEFDVRQRGAELDERLDVAAAELGTEDDDERLFAADGIAEGFRFAISIKGFVVAGQVCGQSGVVVFADAQE